MNKSRVVTHKT